MTVAAIECPYDIRSFNGDPNGLPLILTPRQDRDARRLCTWIGAQHGTITSRRSISRPPRASTAASTRYARTVDCRVLGVTGNCGLRLRNADFKKGGGYDD